MCLAICKPAGKTVPEEYLRNGFSGNSDGAGFAVAIDNEIRIHKGFFRVRKLLKAMRKYDPLLPMLIHFRWATHGEKNQFNCHPWDVANGKYAAVHNGILDCKSSKEMSDTGHFIKDILSPLLQLAPDPSRPKIKELVEMAIKKTNKIALMDRAGGMLIYNEEQGEWDDGIWYSNTGYLHRYSYCNAGVDGFDWEQHYGPAYRRSYVSDARAGVTGINSGTYAAGQVAANGRLLTAAEVAQIRTAASVGVNASVPISGGFADTPVKSDVERWRDEHYGHNSKAPLALVERHPEDAPDARESFPDYEPEAQQEDEADSAWEAWNKAQLASDDVSFEEKERIRFELDEMKREQETEEDLIQCEDCNIILPDDLKFYYTELNLELCPECAASRGANVHDYAG